MTLYKSLDGNYCGPFSGYDFKPYLPRGNKPGKWTPFVQEISMCVSGWHCCKGGKIISFLNANIYEVEVRGSVLQGSSKVCAQQMRFIRKCGSWRENRVVPLIRALIEHSQLKGEGWPVLIWSQTSTFLSKIAIDSGFRKARLDYYGSPTVHSSQYFYRKEHAYQRRKIMKLLKADE